MKPDVIAAAIKTKVTGISKSEEEFKLSKVKNSCKFGLLYTFSGSVKTYKKGNAEDKEINSEIELKNYVKNRLEKIYGGKFYFLKYFDIKQATINHPANSFVENIKNYEDKGIYFSGDNLVHGSIEGAVISGIQVGEKLKKGAIA